MPNDTYTFRSKKTGKTVTFRRKNKADVEPPKHTALPQQQQVEDRISQRGGGFERFKEGFRKFREDPISALVGENPQAVFGDPKTAIFRSPIAKTAMEGVNEIAQRAEAIPANAALSLQQNEPGGVPQAFQRSLEGLKGERLGEFGDVFNKVLPETIGGRSTKPIGDTFGLATSVVVGNIASGDKIRKGLNGIEKTVNRMRTVGRVNKNNTFYLKQAKKLDQGVNVVESGISKEYDNLAEKLKNVKLTDEGVSQVNQVLQDLPEHTLNSVKRQTGLRLAGKAKRGDKVLSNDLNTLKELRTAVGKSVPKKVWKGIAEATPEQIKAMDSYFELSDVLSKNSGEFAETMTTLSAKFKKFHAHRQSIRRIIYDPDGNIKTTQLPNIFKETAEGTLDRVMDFGKEFNDNVFDIVGDIEKFKKVQTAKKRLSTITKVAAPSVIAGELFVRRPLMRATRSAPSSSSDGGF